MSVLQRLHDSEINASIASFWDGCWTARLGDEMNGWLAIGRGLETFEAAEQWLDREARRVYPQSLYATGKRPECVAAASAGEAEGRDPEGSAVHEHAAPQSGETPSPDLIPNRDKQEKAA